MYLFIIISSRNINVPDCAQDYTDDFEYKIIGLSLIANEKFNLNLFLSLDMKLRRYDKLL